jgi:hypothetical protein
MKDYNVLICWIVHIILHNEAWNLNPSFWNSNDHSYFNKFEGPSFEIQKFGLQN